jgi:hypothetical protein
MSNLIELGYIDVPAYSMEDLKEKVDEIRRNHQSLNQDASKIICEVEPEPNPSFFSGNDSVKFKVYINKLVGAV